jgi:hypothetical protein
MANDPKQPKADVSDLEQVEQDIESARNRAREDGVIDDPTKPRWHESGELSDIDDQSIAPG